MKQIQALLQEKKSSRTPTQLKIDSRLLQGVRENRGEQMAKGISLEAADVNANAFGVVKVDINANITDAFLAKITALGGKIIFASERYHTVRASVNLKAVENIAGFFPRKQKFIEPTVKSIV